MYKVHFPQPARSSELTRHVDTLDVLAGHGDEHGESGHHLCPDSGQCQRRHQRLVFGSIESDDTPDHEDAHDLEDASDHETLVSYADTAMYAAKNLGGSRTSFFREEFNHQLQAALQLEAEMRALLRKAEIIDAQEDG